MQLGAVLIRIFLILFIFIFNKAWATSDSGTLLLSATVSETTSIDVIPTASATSLDILNGETATLVATSIIRTNAQIGYLILMQSTNGGHLVNNANSSAKTPYQVKYGNSNYRSPGSVGSPVIVYGAFNFGASTVREHDIHINVSALPSASAGLYTDTVTFTIQAY